MRQRVSKHLAIGAHDLSERLGVDAVALPVVQAATLLLAVERRFVLVPAACGLDRLQEALERRQHANLEMVVESLGLQHLGHFLLHQGHDQSLPGILDLDRFVMVLEPAASPLAPVHVLGVKPARDVEPRDAANEEALGDPSLLVLGDLGIRESRDTDAGFAAPALQYGVTEAEDRELTLDVGVVVLERGGREQQYALGFLREPRLSEGVAIGVADGESHDPVARAAGGAEAMLQVMGLVDNDQVGLRHRAVQGHREGVAKALTGTVRHMPAFDPGRDQLVELAHQRFADLKESPIALGERVTKLLGREESDVAKHGIAILALQRLSEQLGQRIVLRAEQPNFRLLVASVRKCLLDVATQAAESVEQAGEAIKQGVAGRERIPFGGRDPFNLLAEGGMTLEKGSTLLGREQRPVLEDLVGTQLAQYGRPMRHAFLAHQHSPAGVAMAHHHEVARCKTRAHRVRRVLVADTPSLGITALDREQASARYLLHLDRERHLAFESHRERALTPVKADGNAERRAIQPVGFIRRGLGEALGVTLERLKPPASGQHLIGDVDQERRLKVAGAAVAMRWARAVDRADKDDVSAAPAFLAPDPVHFRVDASRGEPLPGRPA